MPTEPTSQEAVASATARALTSADDILASVAEFTEAAARIQAALVKIDGHAQRPFEKSKTSR